MEKEFELIAERMHRASPSACFAITLWNGRSFKYGTRPKVNLRLMTEQAAGEVLTKGYVGLGEAYMSGTVDIEGDIQELLRLGIAIGYDGTNSSLRWKLRLLPWYLKTRCTPSHARSNIAYHYDRGDEFYRLYLDDTMTYSCAYFRNGTDSLEQAQVNKYELISKKLMLRSGDRLLDVGCGWGGMLIHAATRYGARGLGATLSKNQYEYANRRIRELGLKGRIEVVLLDYRKLSGKFDKFVSIGMFEHVGKEFIPAFMRTVSGLLKEGGLGLLHTIATETDPWGESWVNRYIFPGCYIPKLSETLEQMGRFGLSALDVENLRMHYARTLDIWADNYERNIEKVTQMFGDTFSRMWRFYLHASSAGFKYGDNRVYQMLFSKGLNNELPMTREHVYENGVHSMKDERDAAVG